MKEHEMSCKAAKKPKGMKHKKEHKKEHHKHSKEELHVAAKHMKKHAK